MRASIADAVVDMRAATSSAPRALESRDPAFAHHTDAEAGILGGIIIANDVLDRIPDLAADDFFDRRHGIVFEAMRNLAEARRPIDVVTLESELERAGKLEAIGGIAFLGELAARVPTPGNVVEYALDVIEAGDQRWSMLRVDQALERARRRPHEAREIFDQLAHELQGRRRRGRACDGGADLFAAVAELARNRERPVFKTGFPSIDERAPLMGGMIALLNGGSGSGKSTLLLHIARHHAATLGPALYVSLELSVAELASRLVGQTLGVPWFDAFRGACGDAQNRAALNHPKLRVLDDARATVETIRRHVIALQRQYPDELVLVVVDYIQNLNAPGRDDRERVANAMESLRELAKQLGIVAFAASQPSRANTEKLRGGKLVGLDAAAAGAETAQLERAAYVVLSIGEVIEPSGAENAARVAVWIGKARMGRAGVAVWLQSDGRTGTWLDTGEVQTTREHKETKAADKAGREIELIAAAIPAIVGEATEPMSRGDIAAKVKRNKTLVVKAIDLCLAKADPLIVECGQRRHGAFRIWTPTKARQRGLIIHTPTRSDPFRPVPEQVQEPVTQSTFPPVPSSIGAGTGTGGTGDATKNEPKRRQRRNGSRRRGKQ